MNFNIYAIYEITFKAKIFCITKYSDKKDDDKPNCANYSKKLRWLVKTQDVVLFIYVPICKLTIFLWSFFQNWMHWRSWRCHIKSSRSDKQKGTAQNSKNILFRKSPEKAPKSFDKKPIGLQIFGQRWT